MGKMYVEFYIDVRDRDGKLKASRKGRNSILHNFAQHLYAGLTNASVSIKDTSGATIAAYWRAELGGSWANCDIAANSDDDNFGILLGSGDTPVSKDDYALVAPIPQGAGAGNLDHSSVSLGVPTSLHGSFPPFVVGQTFSRSFGATGDVTIAELGMAGTMHDGARDPFYFLYFRDLVLPVVEAESGDMITVTYTLVCEGQFTMGWYALCHNTWDRYGTWRPATDTAGVVKTQPFLESHLGAVSGFGVDVTSADQNHGIIVGSGDNPFTLDDYVLGSAYGTYMGNMSHAIAVSGNIITITLTRTYSYGGASILNIREVGLYGIFVDGLAGQYNIMLYRAVLGADAKVIVNSDTVTVNLVITMET